MKDEHATGLLVLTIGLAFSGGVLVGLSSGRAEVKDCTYNDQCRLPKSEDNGYDVILGKGRDGEIYVWGGK